MCLCLAPSLHRVRTTSTCMHPIQSDALRLLCLSGCVRAAVQAVSSKCISLYGKPAALFNSNLVDRPHVSRPTIMASWTRSIASSSRRLSPLPVDFCDTYCWFIHFHAPNRILGRFVSSRSLWVEWTRTQTGSVNNTCTNCPVSTVTCRRPELYVKPHASSIYAPQKTAGACVATLACFPTSIRRVHGGGGLSRPVPDPHLTSRRTDRSTAWSRLPT